MHLHSTLSQVGDFGTATLMSVAGQHAPSIKPVHETNFGTNPFMSVTQGVGTPLWMAPEVFTGRVDTYNPPVDVYVLPPSHALNTHTHTHTHTHACGHSHNFSGGEFEFIVIADDTICLS